MPSVPEQLNSDILERIPLDARVVLDVGCGTGALAAAYRPLNPRVRLLGIDTDAEAAAIAAQRLDEVAVVDVEQNPLPFPDRPIDCVIYSDVLEHLRDPWAVMRRHVEALSADGMLLICVPNVEHWSFAERLLRGNWDYEPSGLLDATHLRWFSLESMRKGLTEFGLYPCDVHPRVFDVAAAETFVAAMAPALASLGIDPQAYLQRAAPLQYVWRVRKQPRERLVVASTMLEPIGGVSHVRVVYPLQAMETDPSVTTHLIETPEFTLPPVDIPRVFVLHRLGLAGQHGTAIIRTLLKGGWLVVSEFDDHPDHFGMLDSPGQMAFSGVHAVQTSTPALADVLRTRNPEVAVFPNAIRALPDVYNFADEGRMTLFFGALNREQDWAPFIPVLNSVAESMGDRLCFSVVHDRAFFDALHSPHKQFTPTCDYPSYMALLGQCEISFMPLADTPFNRAKSDLKFIESGACRVAPLASHIVYANSMQDGRTGLMFRDPEELRERLMRLVMMPELARSLGDAARDYVINERMLAYQVAQRTAWYRSLWLRRTELTNALYARMPQLAPAETAMPVWSAIQPGA
jgi:SAM-dependent methyltransferase